MSPSDDRLIDPRFAEMTILVVDSSTRIIDMLSKLLRSFGFRDVKIARTEELAFKHTREHRIDIILANYAEEEADDVSLTTMVRRDEASPNKELPVILMTASPNRNMIFKVRDEGANEIIGKPFNSLALFQKLSSVVHNPREYVDSEEFSGPDRRRTHDLEFSGRSRRKSAS